MVHFKIAQSMVDGLYLTLCGKDTRSLELKHDGLRHIPPCDAQCEAQPVTCPDCNKAMGAIREYIDSQRRKASE